ncbi:MAG: hypothetical protein U0353_33055 [Sandaracinus sp.]
MTAQPRRDDDSLGPDYRRVAASAARGLEGGGRELFELEPELLAMSAETIEGP